jgi:O-antigen ligase
VAIAAALCGVSAAEAQRLLSSTAWSFVLLAVLLFGYLVITLSIQPELLFISWLFAAPLLQDSAQQTGLGKDLARVLYIFPPLVLLLLLILKRSSRPLRVFDVLPALYFGYIVVSGTLNSSQPQSVGSVLHRAYITVGVGVIAYYFLAFGPTTSRLGQRFAAVLIGSGSLIAAMAIVDGLTGWNLWHQTVWQSHGIEAGAGISRAVATLGPATLGTFLGIVLAFALAILLWNGPKSLRKLCKACIALSLPALYFTYTRGPMIAIAVVGVSMVIVARRARWPSIVLLIAVAATLFATSGRVASSSVFRSRFADTHNVKVRLVLQRASLTLAERRPIVGWGYGSFNVVKNEANLQSQDPQDLAFNTSHNTFLTVLVELGIVGLALFLLPWSIIYRRALSAARRMPRERWLFAGVVGALSAYVIGASTYDARFFSFVPALPWIVLGVARRALPEGERSGSD